jgi:hypothetical protein
MFESEWNFLRNRIITVTIITLGQAIQQKLSNPRSCVRQVHVERWAWDANVRPVGNALAGQNGST